MRAILAAAFLALALIGASKAQNQQNTSPPAGYKMPNCVEGRAVRIVNGMNGCGPPTPPTLSACGSGTLSANATDFVGSVTISGGLTTCTIVMTKLYNPQLICFVANQNSALILALGQWQVSTTTINSVQYTTLRIPFTLMLSAGAIVGFICTPG